MADQHIPPVPSTFKVYYITCVKSPKGYVGFTSMTVERRFGKHLSDARKGSGWALHAAMRKHGCESFAVELLATASSRAEAAELESRFIREYGTRAPSGYNLTDGGDGARGYRHTEEWKAEMSRRQTGRKSDPVAVERMRQALTGRKATEKARAAAVRRQTGRKHSPETLAKIKESALRRWAENPKTVTPEEAARLRNLAVGRVNTPEHNAAISAALTGKPKSPKHKANMSIAKTAYYEAKRQAQKEPNA